MNPSSEWKAAKSKRSLARPLLVCSILLNAVLAVLLVASMSFSDGTSVCPTSTGSNTGIQEVEDADVANPSVNEGAQQQHHGDGVYRGEEGWILGLARTPSRTANTVYNPAEDAALAEKSGLSRYAQSPVPKGSWKVRVAKDKYITMDDAMFAYDVWFDENQVFQYMSWFGVFMQQDPSDAMAIQDMLWRVKPDLVIEIGTNTGGGALFYATVMKAYNPHGKVVTLDVKPVSNWNKRNNERCVGCIMGNEHPMWNEGIIHFIQGRITEKATQDLVDEFARNATTVLVIEDASHRYPDTLDNIEAAYRYVTVGSYLLTQDTKMDRFVARLGNKYGGHKFGPMRSVDEFVRRHPNFVIDRRFEYFLYSQHHRGFLRRKE